MTMASHVGGSTQTRSTDRPGQGNVLHSNHCNLTKFKPYYNAWHLCILCGQRLQLLIVHIAEYCDSCRMAGLPGATASGFAYCDQPRPLSLALAS